MASSNRPRVVILGAGFGGLTAAKALSKDADVTVVDRHNFQTFLPLLYQVATAGLAAAGHRSFAASGAKCAACRLALWSFLAAAVVYLARYVYFNFLFGHRRGGSCRW